MKTMILALIAMTSLTVSAQSSTCKLISKSVSYANGEAGTMTAITNDAYWTLVRSGDDYELKNMEMQSLIEKTQNNSANENQLILNQNFGKRFALNGYYGTNKFTLDLTTGDAVMTTHTVPHLIADINAPEAERTSTIILKCL